MPDGLSRWHERPNPLLVNDLVATVRLGRAEALNAALTF